MGSVREQKMGLSGQKLGSFESNSITLYDRLYLSTEIIKAHAQASNFFIARCKRGSTFIPIVNLFNGPGWYSQMVIEGVVIHLYKYKNPKTGEFSVLATNLPHGSLDKKDMVALYSRRWEIETTFRDFTSTMKMEQWHSTSLNGILQELYSYFWLFNYTKIQMSINEDEDSVNQLVKNDYKKPNFKLILDFIMYNCAYCPHWLHPLPSLSLFQCVIDDFPSHFWGKF